MFRTIDLPVAGTRTCTFALAILVSFFAVSISAQTSPEVFRYQSAGFDTAHSMAKDSAGNIYIAASVPRSGQETAFAVLKYAPDGRLIWIAHHNASGEFSGTATDVSVDSAGNVYATGYVFPERVSFVTDLVVAAFGPDGGERWSYRAPGGRGVGIVTEPAGNCYVTGAVASPKTGDDWTTMKFAPDGTKLWEQRITSEAKTSSDSTLDLPVEIAMDAAGSLIVTGRTQGAGDILPADITTVKYGPNGDQLFRVVFHDRDQSSEFPFDMSVDPGSNIWVTGFTQIGPYDPLFPVTLKYAPSGALLLALRNENAGGTAVHADPSGDIFLAGFSAAGRFDANGVRIWERSLSFPALRIISDSSGFSYVSGSQQRFGTTTGDYMTVKFDSSGNQMFQFAYNGVGNGHDEVSDILLDNSENLFVVGTSRIDSVSFEDIVTLKFPSGTTPLPQSPAAPSNLTASADSRTQITIRWRDNSNSEDGFLIERCTGSACSDFVEISQVSADATTYVDTGLARRTSYSYRVRAFNAAGMSGYSNVAGTRTRHR